MLDYKITGGLIYDGTGAGPTRADIGIAADRITEVGDLRKAEAVAVIRAENCYVCPGFIDVHAHSDAYLLIEPSAPSKIYQGITTEVIGNCGISAAPIQTPEYLPADWRAQSYPGKWRSMAEYAQLLRETGPAPNVVLLVGHGKLRAWVMGHEARAARADECAAMARLLEQCMEEGARGFSTGLIYAPGMFAGAEEIEELARAAARFGGIYTTHMRNEGAHVLQSIEEALSVARATRIRLQISHLKTAGANTWPLVDEVLRRLHDARAEGLEVLADRYPYIASGTDLDIILPMWARAGGAGQIMERLRDSACRARIRREIEETRAPDYWRTIVLGSTSAAELRGKPLLEAAHLMNVDPIEAALRLIEQDQTATSAFFFGMNEANMWKILADPNVVIGSDSSARAPTGPLSHEFPHPRAYGSFPRFLRAALEGRTVELPQAIRKMTSQAAEHFRLKDRGLVAAGAFADLLVFDPHAVADQASFANPHQLASGMRLVMINGIPTLNAQGLTGQRAGRIL